MGKIRSLAYKYANSKRSDVKVAYHYIHLCIRLFVVYLQSMSAPQFIRRKNNNMIVNAKYIEKDVQGTACGRV
jgi:hypothetical protein